MTARGTVLVVDDDPSIREMLRGALEMQGYVVAEAESGQAALNYLAHKDAQIPSVVLTDLRMPEMNGQDFVRALQSDSRLKDVPVLVMTAVAEVPVMNGVPVYVEKPIDLDTMLSLIDAAMKSRS